MHNNTQAAPLSTYIHTPTPTSHSHPHPHSPHLQQQQQQRQQPQQGAQQQGGGGGGKEARSKGAHVAVKETATKELQDKLTEAQIVSISDVVMKVFGQLVPQVRACCSMLQCVAVCSGVLLVVTSVLQCVAVCVAVCCSISHGGVFQLGLHALVCGSVLQCVAVCCSVLQCVAWCHEGIWSTSCRGFLCVAM